jgi:ribosomal protein S18 acetylase RimI-like enzyme
MHLRAYQPEDLSALYEICLKTTRNGEDGSDDCIHPELVGSFYAAPYVIFDPGMCLILADEAGPCGYVLGAADTRAYTAWFNETWLPEIRTKFQGLEPVAGASDAWLLEKLQEDEEDPDYVDRYPAHLHIDLLPRAQKGGWGRRMIMAWADLAARRGACGFHLGVSAENTNAVGFYRHVGMHEIRAEEWGYVMGMKLEPSG